MNEFSLPITDKSKYVVLTLVKLNKGDLSNFVVIYHRKMGVSSNNTTHGTNFPVKIDLFEFSRIDELNSPIKKATISVERLNNTEMFDLVLNVEVTE
ncbi:MAG: hypothetical protein WAS34_18795 [Thiolinea sp.]